MIASKNYYDFLFGPTAPKKLISKIIFEKQVQSYGGALPSADLLHIALGYWPTVQNLANAIKNEANNTCQFSAVNF